MFVYKETNSKEASGKPIFSYAPFTLKDIRNRVKKVLNASVARDWTSHHHYIERNPTNLTPLNPITHWAAHVKIYERL